MIDLLTAGLAGQTAPVDTAVEYLASTSPVRKFVGGEAAQSGAAHEILSLGVSTSGAERGYLFSGDGALLESAPAADGLVANPPLAIRDLPTRSFAYFLQQKLNSAPEHVAGYPVKNASGAIIGVAVLTRSLATFVDHIRSFEIPFLLIHGNDVIDLANFRERLKITNGSELLLDREVGETRPNGHSFFVDRRPVEGTAGNWC